MALKHRPIGEREEWHWSFRSEILAEQHAWSWHNLRMATAPLEHGTQSFLPVSVLGYALAPHCEVRDSEKTFTKALQEKKNACSRH